MVNQRTSKYTSHTWVSLEYIKRVAENMPQRPARGKQIKRDLRKDPVKKTTMFTCKETSHAHPGAQCEIRELEPEKPPQIQELSQRDIISAQRRIYGD